MQHAKLLGYLTLFALGGAGCLAIVSSQGGGEAELPIEPRAPNPRDVAVQPGYRLEVVAKDLTYPSGITFDDQGRAVVLEAGYAYGEDFATGRLVRIEADGKKTVLAQGKNVPWTGVQYQGGDFYLVEGGTVEGGRIVKIGQDGKRTVLAENLPSFGDHHTNGPAVGDDGYVYFGQGTATNSGVVGEDNWEFGWLKRHPAFHDIPCKDVTLTGENFTTDNPLTEDEDDEAVTGAFLPFAAASTKGQVIKGQVPCSGAVMRVSKDGGPVELVAWGFRNPFGLRFAPNGKLYVTDNGYDTRGSRPVFGNADWLWEVEKGRWYGWPDFADGHRMDTASDNRYTPMFGDHIRSLVTTMDAPPPAPTALFPVHSSATGLDFSRNAKFGFEGQAFVALFGDMAANVGKVLNPVGYSVVRVDPKTGVMYDFAVNKGHRSEPASKNEGGGLERPVDVKFDPAGEKLYIVDYGTLVVDDDVTQGYRRTGVLWRIVPDGVK
ncbi:MAG: glucose dehydrogenase [Polyangiaceae bacterium]|nr:glucose dehydrogenase [Polyangiaceae bacterium]